MILIQFFPPKKLNNYFKQLQITLLSMDLTNILGSKSFDEVKEWAKDEGLRYTEDGNLYLLTNTKKSDNSKAYIKQANGTILEKETNKVVAFSLATPHRHPDSCHEFNEEMDGQDVFECREGVQLRLFSYNGTWRLATTKKIHASESKFTSSRSFADLFWEVAELDLDELDNTLCYTVILEHRENINTFQVAENRISLMCVTNSQGETLTNAVVPGLPPIKQYEFETKTKVMEEAAALPFQKVGFAIVDRDTGERTIILADDYKKAQKMRGQGADLLYRCLVTFLRGKPEDFIKYHPSSVKSFDRIEKAIDSLVESIYFAYRSRYIFKKKFTVDQNMHMILTHLHRDFMESGSDYDTRIPINRQVVKTKILGYSPKRIHLMLKTAQNKKTASKTNEENEENEEKEETEGKENISEESFELVEKDDGQVSEKNDEVVTTE